MHTNNRSWCMSRTLHECIHARIHKYMHTRTSSGGPWTALCMNAYMHGYAYTQKKTYIHQLRRSVDSTMHE